MSRKHATLTVHHPETHIGHPDQIPELRLTDTSKLGSMLQDERFRGLTRVVSPDSQILFGTGGESKFRAIYEPCVMTTSCLEVSAKRTIRPQIIKLGAHLVSDWRKNCSLLLMSSLSVTIKVICALVSQKPVVTPQYLDDLKTAVKARAKLPNPNDYIPPLAESQVNPAEVSFEQNPARETLFQGKIFIFLSPKQFKKLSMAVELGGGTPMLMEEDSDGADDLLTAPHSCVMHSPSDASSAMSQNAAQWTEHVIQRLKLKGLRTIQDSELGYAVLYVSTDCYCNPAVDPDDMMARPPPSQSMSQMPIPEPSQRQIKEEKPSQSSHARGTQRKRGRAESGDDVQPSAKVLRADIGGVIEVKPEPATPRASTSRSHRKPSPAPPSPEPRRSTRRVSPAPNQDGRSPSPSSSSARRPRHTASPSPSPRRQASPSPQKRAKEKSPTPLQTSSKRKRNTPSEIKDEFDDFDFDSVPTRRKGRGRAQEEEVRAEPLDDLVEVDGAKGAQDDFDAVPSRKKGRGRAREEEVRVEPLDDLVEVDGAKGAQDDFDAVPSRRGKRRRTEEPENNAGLSEQAAERLRDEAVEEKEVGGFDEIPTRKKRRGSETANEKRKAISTGFSGDDDDGDLDKALSMIPDEFDMVPSRKKGKRGVTQDTGTRKSAEGEVLSLDDNKNTVKPSTSRTSYAPPTSASQAVPIDSTGFLSTTKPISEQVSADPDHIVPDADVKGGTVVLEASLVARRPGYRDAEKKKSAAECNRWKGRAVKNFKRFKKVGKAAAMALPRIIGGSDLVVHENKLRQGMEAWLREATEAELQYSQAEREASAMFDWDAPKKKSRR